MSPSATPKGVMEQIIFCHSETP